MLEITHVSDFVAGDGRTVHVMRVGAELRGVPVWWDGTDARCGRCSGPLTAMSASCRHARAVKRRMTKAPPPS